MAKMNFNPQCSIFKAARLRQAHLGKIMVAKPPVRASKVGKRNSRALTKTRGARIFPSFNESETWLLSLGTKGKHNQKHP